MCPPPISIIASATGEFLCHVEEEVVGEAVDVLHLVTLLEHEHLHGFLAGNKSARPAQGHAVEALLVIDYSW